jgi:hypothetical protein
LSDRIGQGDGVGVPKWNLKDIAKEHISKNASLKRFQQHVRCHCGG